MFIENQINNYKNELNLNQIIQEQNLQTRDEALFVCDLTKLKEKFQLWQKLMPRVKPYYGESSHRKNTS